MWYTVTFDTLHWWLTIAWSDCLSIAASPLQSWLWPSSVGRTPCRSSVWSFREGPLCQSAALGTWTETAAAASAQTHAGGEQGEWDSWLRDCDPELKVSSEWPQVKGHRGASSRWLSFYLLATVPSVLSVSSSSRRLCSLSCSFFWSSAFSW